MSAEENKAAIRRFIEEGFNEQTLDVANSVYATDCDFHDDWYFGVEAMKDHCAEVFIAFPDVQMTIEGQFAAEDYVVTQWRLRGTNTGSLFGLPPSGKPVDIAAAYIDRFEGGIVVESWKYEDVFSLLIQVGAIESPFGAED